MSATILTDSITGTEGAPVRLTTMKVRLPRIVLAELNTHRVLSRNSASSRAIPVEKRIRAVLTDPFIPEAFAANKPGMQAGDALDQEQDLWARVAWLNARNDAVDRATELVKLGVHKQWANRLIEPFSWTEVIITATEWENFFALRISPDAQPEIRRAAEAMKAAMDASTPKVLQAGQWHLPLVTDEDQGDPAIPAELLPKLSIARCARVSYLTHDGRRDPGVDLALHDRLLAAGHMSPFEHAAVVGHMAHLVKDAAPVVVVSPAVAAPWGVRTSWATLMGPSVPVARGDAAFLGNIRLPWVQARKLIPHEDNFARAKERPRSGE